MLVHVDDIFCKLDDPDSVLTKIDKDSLLKPNSTVEPDVYLGAKLKLMHLENSVWTWGLSKHEACTGRRTK